MTGPIRPIRIEGDVAYVTLTRGYEAIIDASDVPLVEGFNWSVCSRKDRHTVYAVRHERSDPKIRKIRMHRAIMGDPDGFQIDHIDSDGLNNRRSNLRLATHAENARNGRIRKDNTSGFKGVGWNAPNKKWRAEIKVDNKKYYLGCYETIDMAYAAYVAASEKMHGEFARAA